MSAEQLITKNLDIWASSHKTRSTAGRGSSNKLDLYGIKKLRELIFELAVRGKLVPQDENEEPAGALIERIQFEIKSLIDGKKIQKTNIQKSVPSGKTPYELPNGWEWVTLSQIGSIFSGNSINSNIKESKYTGLTSGVPYIATKDVGYGWEEIQYENGVKIPFGEAKFIIAPSDSLLICAEGGSAGKKCGVTTKEVCFGNKLFANSLYGSIESKYILTNYLSPSFYQRFSEEMTGIISGISLASFSKLLIPLPPLAEQKRIVKKVEELMSYCDQLEQAQTDSIAAHTQLVETLLSTLTNSKDHQELQANWQRITEHFDTLFTTEDSIDQLKQTILQLAVMGKLVPRDPNDEPACELLKKIAAEKAGSTKKIESISQTFNTEDNQMAFELPLDWKWVRINEIIETKRDISYGIIKLEKEPQAGGIPTLRCSDVKTRFLDLSNVRRVDPKVEKDYIRTRLKGGEVLLNIRGTLGGVALVPEELAGYNIAREVAMLPFAKYIHAPYIVNSMAAPYFWRMIEDNLKGIAYKGLNLNTLKYLPIPLPPEKMQPQISKKTDELLAICEILKAKILSAQVTKLAIADALVEKAGC